MLNIGDAAAQVAALLTAAGVPAVTDERALNLPGALVGPSGISFELLDATTYLATWDIYLIAPDNGAVHSLNALGAMLAAVRTALEVPEALPQSVYLPNHGADPMPALLLTITTHVTEDTP